MKYCEHCDRWWSNDKDLCPLCEDELQENDVKESEVKKEEPIIGNA